MVVQSGKMKKRATACYVTSAKAEPSITDPIIATMNSHPMGVRTSDHVWRRKRAWPALGQLAAPSASTNVGGDSSYSSEYLAHLPFLS